LRLLGIALFVVTGDANILSPEFVHANLRPGVLIGPCDDAPLLDISTGKTNVPAREEIEYVRSIRERCTTMRAIGSGEAIAERKSDYPAPVFYALLLAGDAVLIVIFGGVRINTWC
jgi:hypothetical protein